MNIGVAVSVAVSATDAKGYARATTLGSPRILAANREKSARSRPSLVETAKLNDVDPLVWLTDVLERIVSGQTKQNRLVSLLPWNWKAAKAAEAANTS